MRELIEDIQNNGVEHLGRFYSVYRAYCVDNRDPENKGRIHVICAAVWGEVPFDEWIYPFGVISGDGHGFFSVPAVGETVNIMFENGEMYSPIWTHGWWGDDELPEEAKNRYDKVTLLKTKGGSLILIDDDENFIKIKSAKGANVLVEGDKVTLDAKNVVLSKDAERAVLGDKLESFMNDLIDEITKIKTVQGGPVTPDNIAKIQALKLKTKNFLSKNVKLR